MIDTGERSVALPSTGLLTEFHAADVLGLADVHTALGLGRIGGEADEAVLLAAALTVRALRGGSVCFDLATAREAVFDADEQEIDITALAWPETQAWLAACRDSVLVTNGDSAEGARPLRLVDSTLYLERYWVEEEIVRTQLQHRRDLTGDHLDLHRLAAGLDRIFDAGELDPDEPDRQRIAAATAVLGRVTVLAGGPGTGKTTTVAKVLALLADQAHDRRLRAALAAPTGKAAARLAEAVREATAQLPDADAERIGPVPAFTLHRLLGTLPDRRGRFRHHAENPLPYDVVVVDEMSMVSLPMMARVLEAVRPTAHLILVGDPDQLSSVEAGAVMADITGSTDEPGTQLDTSSGYAELPALADDGRGLTLPADIRRGVVRLTHTWRFGGAIGSLAAAVRAGDDDTVVEVLRGGHDDVAFIEVPDGELTADGIEDLRRAVVDSGTALVAAAQSGDPELALRTLDTHRLLCAHRTGPYGVARWSRESDRWLAPVVDHHGLRSDEWYAGRPVLITANDYELGLFNGDTGVVVATGNGLRAVFARGRQTLSFAPARLEDVQTVHAMTVHRSQGSQFRDVSFVVPPTDSPLLTRELLYTAVTRATTQVTLIGSESAVRRAVTRPANRASGLRRRL